MPARSRWRQRRGLRRSCTLRTRQRQPPQRGMLVVGSTSQTRPVSVNSTALTTVNLIPSTVLSRVVARMVVGAPKVGLGTPEVPLRPCAFHNHSFSPTSYQPIPGEFRHPATRSRPRGFHQTYQRAIFFRVRPARQRARYMLDVVIGPPYLAIHTPQSSSMVRSGFSATSFTSLLKSASEMRGGKPPPGGFGFGSPSSRARRST